MIAVAGPEVVAWVHLELHRHCPDKNLAQGLGFTDLRGARAGVTYSNWNGVDIEVAAAADKDFAWTRGVLRAIFCYPFKQLDARRVTARVEEHNLASRAFLERLGFTLEATLSEACKAGDLLLFRLFSKDCRWLR